jgi:hypothetical protein
VCMTERTYGVHVKPCMRKRTKHVDTFIVSITKAGNTVPTN